MIVVFDWIFTVRVTERIRLTAGKTYKYHKTAVRMISLAIESNKSAFFISI